MPRVPTMADVHHATLVRAGRGDDLVDTRKERRPGRKTPKVSVIRVDPRVWKVALRLAKGDAKRIQVRNAEAVTVHNNADWFHR